MKNTTELMSIRVSARANVRRCLRNSSVLRCTRSPTSQTMPSPNRMPRKGGRPVSVLKSGTATSMPNP